MFFLTIIETNISRGNLDELLDAAQEVLNSTTVKFPFIVEKAFESEQGAYYTVSNKLSYFHLFTKGRFIGGDLLKVIRYALDEQRIEVLGYHYKMFPASHLPQPFEILSAFPC